MAAKRRRWRCPRRDGYLPAPDRVRGEHIDLCPDGLQERAYGFWEVAQRDILAEWTRQTDPANLQPRVRPLNHRVAEFIRSNPPLDVPDERVNRALDILESPWPRREEIMLREWFAAPDHQGSARSHFLIEKILETGLERVEPPPALPPITPEDIELLCWIGIEPEEAKAPPRKAEAGEIQ